MADSTHKIALGLAIGAGVSFTPLLGTHFIQAGILAFLFRGNIFSAMMGTFIGNPWTFPFFWWAGFSFGKLLSDLLGFEAASHMPDEMTAEIMWEMMKHEPMTLFVPWMLGGYILLFATMPISYTVYYYIVSTAKTAKAKAKALRMKQRKKEAASKS